MSPNLVLRTKPRNVPQAVPKLDRRIPYVKPLDFGTIQYRNTTGKHADIIAVRGDVLRYINLLRDVDLVIKHGKRYK